MTEVTWRGHTIPVKNEKARSFILHSQQSTRELDRAETLDSKLSLYDNLLMECKDALQAVKDELKGDTVSCYFTSRNVGTLTGQVLFFIPGSFCLLYLFPLLLGWDLWSL